MKSVIFMNFKEKRIDLVKRHKQYLFIIVKKITTITLIYVLKINFMKKNICSLNFLLIVY